MPVRDDLSCAPVRGWVATEVRFGVVLRDHLTIAQDVDEHFVILVERLLRSPVKRNVKLVAWAHGLVGDAIAEQFSTVCPSCVLAHRAIWQLRCGQRLAPHRHAARIGAEVHQFRQRFVAGQRDREIAAADLGLQPRTSRPWVVATEHAQGDTILRELACPPGHVADLHLDRLARLPARRGVPGLHARQLAQVDRPNDLALVVEEIKGEAVVLIERLQRLPVQEKPERRLRHLGVPSVVYVEADEAHGIAERDVGAILGLVQQRPIGRRRRPGKAEELIRQGCLRRAAAENEIAVFSVHEAELLAGQ